LAYSAFAQATISGCQSFPANNFWNTAVDILPVHPLSAAFIAKIGPTAGLRLDDTMPICGQMDGLRQTQRASPLCLESCGTKRLRQGTSITRSALRLLTREVMVRINGRHDITHLTTRMVRPWGSDSA
jgi:hypothetical protein